MHCPFCQNTLIPFEEHHLHLDRCPEGHGIWFDGGELEAYRKKYPDIGNAPREETHQFQPLPGEVIKDCPRCRRTTLEAGRLYELNVHHCFTCHGVFLGQPTTCKILRIRLELTELKESKLEHQSLRPSSLHFDRRVIVIQINFRSISPYITHNSRKVGFSFPHFL